MISPGFLLTALIVVLIPGTGVIFTINTGLSQGTKQTIAAAIGCTLGIVPHMLACILGLSAIMHMSAQTFTLIKFCGALYLMYLAVMTWKHAGTSGIGNSSVSSRTMPIVLKGILLNLLNPKLTLFFFSFLPQFIKSGADNQLFQMIILSAIFMMLTLIVFIFYGVLANGIKELTRTKKSLIKNIERGFSVIFAGLSLKLLMDDK